MKMPKIDKIISKMISKLDAYQQKHSLPAFIVAVIKRYNDDEAGNQSALITYYGFLSLFPLLLVLTSVLEIISNGNDQFKDKIISSAGSYFPILGDRLQSNIQGPNKTGIILFFALLFTFYGARGGADAFRNAINTLWHIPKDKRQSFPNTILGSFKIIIVGGVGLLSSALISTYATGLGRSFVFQILASFISTIIITTTLYIVIDISLEEPSKLKFEIFLAALFSAMGILLLQRLGGYILTNQLRNLNDLYGTFAIVLGLIFWIYLQAKVMLFAVVASIVLKHHLWPISLVDKNSNK